MQPDRLVDELYQAARIRFGDDRAAALRPAIEQAARSVATVLSFPIDLDDEPCLRGVIDATEPQR